LASLNLSTKTLEPAKDLGDLDAKLKVAISSKMGEAPFQYSFNDFKKMKVVNPLWLEKVAL